MRIALLVMVAGLFLAGCGADQGADPGSTASKAAICGRALGIVALSEVGDDIDRRAEEAGDAASALRTLSTQTQDHSLSDALVSAAHTAEQAARQHLGGDRLKAWATQERARFDAIRKVCF
jgi:hypothetical protein